MTNSGNENNKTYDLEERTTIFSEDILEFVKQIPQNAINIPMITQLVKSATSVGANYCEADNAVSKRDFKNKIGICRKEAKETRYWLRLIAKSNESLKDRARVLFQEAKELNLIFSKIFNRSKSTKI